jgi:hypothetical protein
MKIPSVLGLKTTAIISGVTLVLGVGAGWKLHDALIYQPHLKKELKAVVTQKDVVQAATEKGIAVAETHKAQLATKTAEREATTRIIQKEIPRYVTIPAIGHPLNDVPVGFGLLHDYAATATPPPAAVPSGLDLSAPSGIGMSAVADTITHNYGVCKAYRDEAEQWRAWHGDLKAWWVETDKALSQ